MKASMKWTFWTVVCWVSDEITTIIFERIVYAGLFFIRNSTEIPNFTVPQSNLYERFRDTEFGFSHHGRNANYYFTSRSYAR